MLSAEINLYFNVKRTSIFDKTATSEASVSSAAARLTVASWISSLCSSVGFFKGSLKLPGFVTAKVKPIGYGIQYN